MDRSKKLQNAPRTISCAPTRHRTWVAPGDQPWRHQRPAMLRDV